MIRPIAASLVFLFACGSPGPEIGGDDAPGPDGGVDPDGGGNSDGGTDPDAEVPCTATGEEVHGDDVDNDCDGLVDEVVVCGDGSQSFTTISAAIAAAPDGGGIEVCAGTYQERLVVTTKSVHISGAGADSTIVDADQTGTAVVVSGGHTLTLEGLTVRGGLTTGLGGGARCADAGLRLVDSAMIDNEAGAGGGGVYGLRCAVEIQATRFQNNEGGEWGGAGYFVNSTGTIASVQATGNSSDKGGVFAFIEGMVTVSDSTMTGNTARVRGGAILQASDGIVEDSTMSGNYAGWIGGAVYVDQHAPIFRRNIVDDNEGYWEAGGFYLHQTAARLEDNEITNNSCWDDGGGLRIFESTAHLEGNLIAYNHAVDGDGGGLKNSHVSSTFIDNDFIGNIALGAGGGIELDNCSSVLRGGTISGNDSSIGGGVHVMLWPWNGGVIEDVRIAGNSAHRGGGIYIENNYVPVNVRRLVVEDNEAWEAAGVYSRGTQLRLSNSLIRNNHAGNTGGGFFVHPSSQYPWTKPCPCPPIDPPATVEFVVLHGNTGDDGTAVWLGAPNLTFDSTIITSHAANAVTVVPGAIPTWRYNDTFPATFSGMANPTGSNGNLSTDPAFMAPDTGDFQLAEGSACIDAGNPAVMDVDGSRADIGMHAGPHAP